MAADSAVHPWAAAQHLAHLHQEGLEHQHQHLDLRQHQHLAHHQR